MSRLIDDFKNKISSYDKEYRFSQEEVLNILQRCEIKYENVKAIPLDKIKKAREKIASSLDGLDEHEYVEKVAKFYIERDLRILDELIESEEKE